MLRNRSKEVTSKQALMADQAPLLSPTKNPSTSSLISPKLHPDSETTSISPKSILDTKNSSTSVNPFGHDTNPTKPQIINPCNKTEQEAIGLALIDSLNLESANANSPKSINRMALFGSNLKVQIPAAAVAAPKSPADFGIKTRNTQLLGLSPDTPGKVFSRQLSLKEMELSEDYTCVITHGPNPKTTHIFEDVVIFYDKEIECGINVTRSSSDSCTMFCISCKDSGEISHKCQREEKDFEGNKS